MDADIYRDNYDCSWLAIDCLYVSIKWPKFILNTIFYNSFTHLAGISTEVGGSCAARPLTDPKGWDRDGSNPRPLTPDYTSLVSSEHRLGIMSQLI